MFNYPLLTLCVRNLHVFPRGFPSAVQKHPMFECNPCGALVPHTVCTLPCASWDGLQGHIDPLVGKWLWKMEGLDELKAGTLVVKLDCLHQIDRFTELLSDGLAGKGNCLKRIWMGNDVTAKEFGEKHNSNSKLHEVYIYILAGCAPKEWLAYHLLGYHILLERMSIRSYKRVRCKWAFIYLCLSTVIYMWGKLGIGKHTMWWVSLKGPKGLHYHCQLWDLNPHRHTDPNLLTHITLISRDTTQFLMCFILTQCRVW